MSHKISVTGEKKGINNPKLAAMLRRTNAMKKEKR